MSTTRVNSAYVPPIESMERHKDKEKRTLYKMQQNRVMESVITKMNVKGTFSWTKESTGVIRREYIDKKTSLLQLKRKFIIFP